jgi:hypothetical protein
MKKLDSFSKKSQNNILIQILKDLKVKKSSQNIMLLIYYVINMMIKLIILMNKLIILINKFIMLMI